MIRVVLPHHLRTLAGVTGEIQIDPADPTPAGVVDALERTYPALHGTIRDPATQQRRPFVRYFACEQDLSHDPPAQALPEAVVTGREPFFVIGAMAGG